MSIQSYTSQLKNINEILEQLLTHSKRASNVSQSLAILAKEWNSVTNLEQIPDLMNRLRSKWIEGGEAFVDANDDLQKILVLLRDINLDIAKDCAYIVDKLELLETPE